MAEGITKTELTAEREAIQVKIAELEYQATANKSKVREGQAGVWKCLREAARQRSKLEQVEELLTKCKDIKDGAPSGR